MSCCKLHVSLTSNTNWGLSTEKIMFMPQLLPAKCGAVYEDAIINSLVFVFYTIFVLTTYFSKLFQFENTGLILIILNCFSNLAFLNKNGSSFLKIFRISFLNGKRHPWRMRFNCSIKSSSSCNRNKKRTANTLWLFVTLSGCMFSN